MSEYHTIGAAFLSLYMSYKSLKERIFSQRESWLDVAILLTPSKVKGSHYLLIPKGLAQLLEIQEESILKLTIEEGN